MASARPCPRSPRSGAAPTSSSSSRASTPIARSRTRSARSSPTTRRWSSRSLDEAYLDVTEDLKGIGIATTHRRGDPRADPRRDRPHRPRRRLLQQVPRQARQRPEQARRPVRRSRPAQGAAFVASLPVKRFHGVGPKTAEKMARLGIETGADLRAQSLAFLTHNFGSSGAILLQPRPRHLPSPGQARPALQVDRRRGHLLRRPDRRGGPGRRARPDQPDRLAAHRREEDQRPDGDSQGQISAISGSSPAPAASTAPVAGREEFLDIGCALLRTLLPPPKGIRLLGLTLSNLTEGSEAVEQPAILELPL